MLGVSRAGVTPFHIGSMNSRGFARSFPDPELNARICLCTEPSPAAGEGPRAWKLLGHDFPSWDEVGAEGQNTGRACHGLQGNALGLSAIFLKRLYGIK